MESFVACGKLQNCGNDPAGEPGCRLDKLDKLGHCFERETMRTKLNKN